MRKTYVCGLDFGTLSCRAVIVDTSDGSVAGEAICEYPHGVITKALPSGTSLTDDFALQDPEDYLISMEGAVKKALAASGIPKEEVKGIGLDFTSCTILPVDEAYEPLCKDPRFANDPHAWVKLWKHHGAAREAADLTKALYVNNDICDYPGTEASPEHGFPKILETMRRSPAVFDAAYRFTEAGDWVASFLTGKECHGAPFSGYKFLWQEGKGYPDRKLLDSAEKGLGDVPGSKLSEDILPVAKAAGSLCQKAAAFLGLAEDTVVASATIDAHAAVPGAGAVFVGDMAVTMGTSACHMLNAAEYRDVPGIFGCMKDGAVPELYTYEAGQSAVGDIFGWFAENAVPSAYEKEAASCGISIHALLTKKAAVLCPGESGLIAVDWLNGCRTPLNDASLKGAVFGLALSTKPEEQYRAWLESAAFGTRRIIENYEENGVPVKRVYLCGGIAKKNALFVKILADVLRKEIRVTKEAQCTALGSAIYAAVAARIHASVKEAALFMSSPVEKTVLPDPEAGKAYDDLYMKYLQASDFLRKFN